jgi:hypothetical protein
MILELDHDGSFPSLPRRFALMAEEAVPFFVKDTATNSCSAGGNGLVVSQTVTRSLSMIGWAAWLSAAKHSSETILSTLLIVQLN